VPEINFAMVRRSWICHDNSKEIKVIFSPKNELPMLKNIASMVQTILFRLKSHN
jgi:hypothetical protein